LNIADFYIAHLDLALEVAPSEYFAFGVRILEPQDYRLALSAWSCVGVFTRWLVTDGETGGYCGCRRTPQYLASLWWHDWSYTVSTGIYSLVGLSERQSWRQAILSGVTHLWRCRRWSRDRVGPGERRQHVTTSQSAPERWAATFCLVVYTVFTSILLLYCHISLRLVVSKV